MRTRAATVALGFVVCAFVSAVVSAAEPAGQPLIAGVGRGGFAVVADAGLKQVFVGRIAVPEYPHEGRRDHWSGSGIFRALVTPAGEVADVTVVKSTGYRVMDESVLLAARRWRGKPGRNREVDFSMTFVAPPRRGMPGQ
jgi:TonB family protein